MTGNQPYKSNFREFAAILGYPFNGRNSKNSVLRMHEHGVEPDKNKLTPHLYMAGGCPELVNNLHLLYDILLCVFCCNISPSAGNNDTLCGGLIYLLYHSFNIFHNG
jgi:hypothetical protein